MTRQELRRARRGDKHGGVGGGRLASGLTKSPVKGSGPRGQGASGSRSRGGRGICSLQKGHQGELEVAVAAAASSLVMVALRFLSLWCQEEKNPLGDPAGHEEERGTRTEEEMFVVKPDRGNGIHYLINTAGGEEQRCPCVVSG